MQSFPLQHQPSIAVRSVRSYSRASLLAALLVTCASTAWAQTGTIEGTVRNANTAEVVANTRVTVVGTELAATANANGYYRIEGVPPGAHQVLARVLGYSAVTVQNVLVVAGLPVTVDIELQPAIVRLDAVVVTGTVGETPRAKLPFSVEQITVEDLPVAQVDPLSALQGKVAGATVMRANGQPGTVPTVLLRGPTSIDARGRNQEPLYVVDGVILGVGLTDVDALDIESIEIVKGAAAASLYGSRAEAGVIQIRTRRGSELRDGDIRFTIRSEYGGSSLPGRFPLVMHHSYAMNEDGSKFLDADGNECDFLECESLVRAGQGAAPGQVGTQWNTYMTQDWPGTTYDQVERFFTGGGFSQQYVSVAGRAGDANLHASYSNVREEGVFPGAEGLRRNNFRVNLDQRVGQRLTVSATAFYSRARQDDPQNSQLAYSPLLQLQRTAAGVDLLQLNDDPRILPDGSVDSNDVIQIPGKFDNPLYHALNDGSSVRRGRFLGSTNLRLRLLSWLTADGNVSYDRSDVTNEVYFFKGYRAGLADLALANGSLSQQSATTEAFNATGNITVSQRFGDLATRGQLRYLGEWDEYRMSRSDGRSFTVDEVPTFGNVDPTTLTATSSVEPIRADGVFAIANLDFHDRYILDGLIRNDGSSLFGEDERRHWYFRVAGAWRVSEDLRLPGVDELKLRYAVGTAGGRPAFWTQYETYSVSGGRATPGMLGNRDLKPERATEHEAGIDLVLFGRAAVTVNYARSVIEDQLLEVPVSKHTGFAYQWQNAGTLETRTWEATLDLSLLQTGALQWSVRAVFDRTRNEITSWEQAPYQFGQFYYREGESLGAIYGRRFAQSCGELFGTWDCSEFAVNDDGWLVWVGPDGSLADRAWGTAGPVISGQTLYWGTPFLASGVDPFSGDTTALLKIGSTIPDFTLGLSTTIRWGGLSVYALADWVQGADVYNWALQYAYLTGTAGPIDQSAVPEGLRKPLGYYQALYASAAGTNAFVEDGSFLKLREVSLQYRVSRNHLQRLPLLRGLQELGVSFTGRNLLTLSDFRGYDPEVGQGDPVGSPAIARRAAAQYPPFRTFTVALEVTF